MSEYVLEMNNITKTFPGVTVLNNVTFKVNKREIHSLIGENGAGKTTLMKILSGFYPYNSFEGNIRVNNQLKLFKSPGDAEKAGIEMIYQETNVMPDLTIAENIFVGNYPTIRNKIIDWNKLNTNAGNILEKIGFKINPKEKVKNLSASQKQLVTIARALSKQPQLLILDEPTSSLTPKEITRLFEIIRELKTNGISSIFISHKIEEVLKISDKITILRDGENQGVFSKEDVSQEKIIIKMVGKKFDNFFPTRNSNIGETVLRVENLSVPHLYNTNKKLIDNISFQLNKGEILGLGGLVGSGRSELASALFGYNLKPEAGQIFIEGKQVYIKSPIDAINNGLALMTEDRKLDGIISMLDIKKNISVTNLERISKRGIIDKNKEEELCLYFKDKLSIKANNTDTKLSTLSGGNQQKVVLSKWLMVEPKVLILDEPTRGIDIGAKTQIYNIMTDLVKEGISIIMISSELPELLAMCDRFIVLYSGKIKDEFNKNEATEERYMKAASGIL